MVATSVMSAWSLLPSRAASDDGRSREIKLVRGSPPRRVLALTHKRGAVKVSECQSNVRPWLRGAIGDFSLSPLPATTITQHIVYCVCEPIIAVWSRTWHARVLGRVQEVCPVMPWPQALNHPLLSGVGKISRWNSRTIGTSVHHSLDPHPCGARTALYPGPDGRGCRYSVVGVALFWCKHRHTSRGNTEV